jgi:hypothetical protein
MPVSRVRPRVPGRERAPVVERMHETMARQAANRTGKYLYAVITGADDRSYGSPGIGGGDVYTLSDGQIAAVISDVPDTRIRPERSNLAAHQEVLRRIMEEATPLPMTFGVIAHGPTAVRKILSLHRKVFIEQLRRVAAKVEMGLRVTWDVPNIFEYFVLTHPELRAARDRFLGSHREPTQEDKIEVGRMFDRMLNEDREAYAEKVEQVLSPCCVEIRRNPPRNEREVVGLACLVGRKTLPKFEKCIFEAAKLFDNNFAFDYNGPWAPHNFVDIELEL